MSAFGSVERGLEEAKAFSKGQGTDARVPEIAVPDIDVANVRAGTGLSQAESARGIGIAKSTLLNWEHGRRKPNGPAQALLALTGRKPTVVQEPLGNRN